MRLLLLLIWSSAIPAIIYGQCPPVDFSLLSNNVCINERLDLIKPPGENEVSFSWDFCSGSLLTDNPVSETGSAVSLISQPFDVDAAEENGNAIVFVANKGTSKIVRLDYSGMFSEFVLASDVASINFPQGIELFEISESKYAAVTSETGVITLLTFGDSWLNQPVASLIASGFPDARHTVVRIVNSKIYLLVVWNQSGSGKLTVLELDSPTDEAPASNTIDITGSNFMVDVVLINECGSWYAMASGYLSGVHLLSFGTNLMDVPSQTILPVSNPLSLAYELVEGNKYLFVSSGSGAASDKITRIDFGATITNPTPDRIDIAVIENSFPIAFNIKSLAGASFGISVGYVTNKATVITFPRTCNVNNDFSGMSSPEIVYTESGDHKIQLTVNYSNGSSVQSYQSITVRDAVSPALNIETENVCANHEILFTPVTSPTDIDAYDWNLGDLSSHVTTASVAHLYEEPGDYTVRLDIVATNTCKNSASLDLHVYPQPDASFLPPAADVLCTRNEISFLNNTTDNFDGLLSFSWLVDDQVQEDVYDLIHTFESTGNAIIKLVASIPGCSDEEIYTTAPIKEGPEIGFTYEGICENVATKFTSEVSEPVIGFEWKVNGDAISDQTDPSYTFDHAGEFSISMTAITESGCNSTITNDVVVYPEPTPDFKIPSAAVYCSGVPVNVENTTPSAPVIETLQWDFDDGSEIIAGQVSQHTYDVAGTYNILLTVETDHGCVNTVTKPVAISGTPEVRLEHTPVCVGVPTEFTPDVSGDIIVWDWKIGDKTYTNAQPAHIFRVAGNYGVSLKVTDKNGCSFEVADNIQVPVSAEPDFIVSGNCVGQAALFTDVTESEDPITAWEWTVENTHVLTGNPSSYLFSQQGDQEVTLAISTESGCTYTKIKTVSIVPFPESMFTISSPIGSPPFPVDFTNRSKNATHYLWQLNGDTFSTDETPVHTFTEEGEYTIMLKVSNEEGCEHTSEKTISITAPRPDVNVIALTTKENADKTLNITVTLQNEGNTILTNLPVDIDVAGVVNLREIIEGPVFPLSRATLTLGYGLTPSKDVTFVCAEAILGNDQTPALNRDCIEFTESISFLPGYPNPVTEILNVEWISTDTQIVKASLRNSLGIEVWELEFTSQKGLNQQRIEVENLQRGIYMLLLEGTGIKTMQRLLLSK